MFTVDRLQALAGGPAPLAHYCAPFLDEYATAGGVISPLRRAHFIAQVCHESGGFSRMTESLNYSAERIAAVWPRLAARADELAHNPEALGNAAYASYVDANGHLVDRMGNGDEASGDGFRFIGRGLIELTGRDNYRTFGLAVGVDLVLKPERAAEPEIAVRIAYAFWAAKKCNAMADRDDVEAVTRAINGGLNGLKERDELTRRAKAIFVDAEPLIAPGTNSTLAAARTGVA